MAEKEHAEKKRSPKNTNDNKNSATETVRGQSTYNSKWLSTTQGKYKNTKFVSIIYERRPVNDKQ